MSRSCQATSSERRRRTRPDRPVEDEKSLLLLGLSAVFSLQGGGLEAKLHERIMISHTNTMMNAFGSIIKLAQWGFYLSFILMDISMVNCILSLNDTALPWQISLVSLLSEERLIELPPTESWPFKHHCFGSFLWVTRLN